MISSSQMPEINWEKENLTPEQFFRLPQSERLKIVTRHIPLKLKIPFFIMGIMGILINCLVSAFAGTTLHNMIIDAGNTEFMARFWSIAVSLFSLQVLNAGMDKTGRWILEKLYRGRQ